MDDLDVISRLKSIAVSTDKDDMSPEEVEYNQRLHDHKLWLQYIRHEHPNPAHHLRVAVYIRYFNQTKYEHYLDYHKKQFDDTLALCPNWELVGYYIDMGASTPNMESAAEWSRLLTDCMDGKVDLIITQKVSNVSKKPHEITLCARMLAAQTPPIGMYFVSEDIYTLASYYQEDLHDDGFLPTPDWEVLPEDEVRGLLSD